jgi:hypothetical protein
MSGIEAWRKPSHPSPARPRTSSSPEQPENRGKSIEDWGDSLHGYHTSRDQIAGDEYTLLDFANEYEEVGEERAKLMWEEQQKIIEAAEEAQRREIQEQHDGHE